MPKNHKKCPLCKRLFNIRAIHEEKGIEGCNQCHARLSKGLKPLKYGRNPKKVKK